VGDFVTPPAIKFFFREAFQNNSHGISLLHASSYITSSAHNGSQEPRRISPIEKIPFVRFSPKNRYNTHRKMAENRCLGASFIDSSHILLYFK